ncbi:MAG: ATP-binding cassette domain-containing protein, partial [Cyanobium sp.]
KTTLLRLIAGFEQPQRGRIWIDGREVAGPGRFLAPERRGVGMVFQDYALFPHLDAVANARFGLRRGEAPDRVNWLFALLGLEGLEHRYPGMGERQATLRGIDLALQPGELVGLLGPSGCGKTTLLRLIAGFEQPQRGRIWIDGREVAGPGRFLAPERRGVGMVFQDY